MAKAAAKKKTGAKKTASRSSAAEAPVKKKAAAKKAAPQKAAPKKAVTKKAAAKVPAKRPVARPAAKKKAAAAPAKRPLARPPAKKQAAAAKRPVGRPPSKKAAAPARRVPPPTRKTTPKKAAVQSFNVSHLNEADFKVDGLRSYAQYRDLGIAAATGGLCQAHVIRLIPPCTDEVRKRHTHAVELQLIYVLKGWIKNEFEGHGTQMMSAGTCWLQPPGIKHTVLDYSADCEMLEIIVPADFKTVDLA